MVDIQFKLIEEINKSEIIDFMNNPLIRRHMPLLMGVFDLNAYEAFVASKKELWAKHGYGPYAFVIDGKFAGWGGLQYEQGDADIALVLHPDYWGMGKKIYKKIIHQAFNELGFKSVTILLPVSRKHLKGLSKLRFFPDGEVICQGEKFQRYRLYANCLSD